MAHELTDETIAHLSGGRIKRMPDPPKREPDPVAAAAAASQRLSGTNQIRTTLRGREWQHRQRWDEESLTDEERG